MNTVKAAAGCSPSTFRCSPCSHFHPCRPIRHRAPRSTAAVCVNAIFPSYSGVTDTGSLNPGQYWYPRWMQYRQRPDNYSFWTQRFKANSLEIPATDKRWTVLSTLWWVVRYWHFYMIPVWIRCFFSVLWRELLLQAYYLHRKVILQQAKMDAHLANKYSNGVHKTFSKTMALRRLHFRNSLLGEILYYINLYKTGRVHMLPPEKRPTPRPSFGFLF